MRSPIPFGSPTTRTAVVSMGSLMVFLSGARRSALHKNKARTHPRIGRKPARRTTTDNHAHGDLPARWRRRVPRGGGTPFPSELLARRIEAVSGPTHKRAITVAVLGADVRERAGDLRELMEKAIAVLRSVLTLAASSLSDKHPEARGVPVRPPLTEGELVTAIGQHRVAVSNAAALHGARNLQTFSEKAIETRPVLVVDLDNGRDYFDVDALEEEIGVLTGIRPHIVTAPSVRLEERERLTPLP